jgi:hypothetical protein
LPKTTLAPASVLADDGIAGLKAIYYHASPVIRGLRYQSEVLEDYSGQSLLELPAPVTDPSALEYADFAAVLEVVS